MVLDPLGHPLRHDCDLPERLCVMKRKRKDRGSFNNETEILKEIDHAHQLAQANLDHYMKYHQPSRLVRHEEWLRQAQVLGEKLSIIRTPLLPGMPGGPTVPK